jgi:3-dehydroquinate dehydratase-1
VRPTPQPATLRSVVLGDGRPAVCVPLVARTASSLGDAAASLTRSSYDLVELRVDHLTAVDDAEKVREAVAAVRGALPDDVPVLFTFRTKQEGGDRDITPEEYGDLLRRTIRDGVVDAVDVEMYTQPDVLESVVETAHHAGVVVVMSSHDFTGTPPRAEILSRLLQQQEHGADVVKLAAVPTTPADVLTLLAATDDFRSGAGLVPAITMSMGPLGAASRLVGETFGSCLTFATASASAEGASAPGQLEAAGVRAALELLHGATTSEA